MSRVQDILVFFSDYEVPENFSEIDSVELIAKLINENSEPITWMELGSNENQKKLVISSHEDSDFSLSFKFSSTKDGEEKIYSGPLELKTEKEIEGVTNILCSSFKFTDVPKAECPSHLSSSLSKDEQGAYLVMEEERGEGERGKIILSRLVRVKFGDNNFLGLSLAHNMENGEVEQGNYLFEISN